MKAWEAIRDTFIEMGLLKVGTETAGSSTTLFTDTSQSLTVDGLIGGSIMCLSADGAAPEGEIRRITDNDATTITVSTAFSVANAVGDVFGWASKELREEMYLMLVNMALKKIGNVGNKDTSITTANDQTEYTLPSEIYEGKIAGVYIQNDTDDSNDNRWQPVMGWRIQPNTAGTDGIIIIPQFPADYTIMIEYIGRHPTITAYSDYINEAIHPELFKASLKLEISNYRAEGAISNVDGFNRCYNKAAAEFDEALMRFPVMLPEQRPKLFQATSINYEDPGPNKVRLS